MTPFRFILHIIVLFHHLPTLALTRKAVGRQHGRFRTRAIQDAACTSNNSAQIGSRQCRSAKPQKRARESDQPDPISCRVHHRCYISSAACRSITTSIAIAAGETKRKGEGAIHNRSRSAGSVLSRSRVLSSTDCSGCRRSSKSNLHSGVQGVW